jgi:hypothetical protein
MADQIGDFFLVDPACHEDQIVVRDDPQDALAGADGCVTGFGCRGPFALAGIEPPEIPLPGIDEAGCTQGVDPTLWQIAPPLPHPTTVNQQAKAGMVEAVDLHATAPMGAAGH